jgi:hypothetical protein
LPSSSFWNPQHVPTTAVDVEGFVIKKQTFVIATKDSTVQTAVIVSLPGKLYIYLASDDFYFSPNFFSL